LSRCRSTTRHTSSSPPAPPATPSASCTLWAYGPATLPCAPLWHRQGADASPSDGGGAPCDRQGPLLQHKKEHIIHGGITRDDVVFQYTTTGWMMWNWLLGVLSVGATIVLFDGSPFKPDPVRIWKLVDELKCGRARVRAIGRRLRRADQRKARLLVLCLGRITVFGTSAKYLAALEEAKVSPKEHASLVTLKAIYSTGSPLHPDSFTYVYNHIKHDVMLSSITGTARAHTGPTSARGRLPYRARRRRVPARHPGGTDIVSLFAGHNTALPVYRGEVQCRCLGMKVESWTEDGASAGAWAAWGLPTKAAADRVHLASCECARHGRPVADWRGGRPRVHPAVPVHAGVLLERRRRHQVLPVLLFCS